MNVKIFRDQKELARATAEQLALWIDQLRQCRQLQSNSNARKIKLALSGGSTPEPLYRLLAQPEWRDEPGLLGEHAGINSGTSGSDEPKKIDWSQIELYWSDERAVPPDSPESNYGLVNRSLLTKLARPPAAIHRMRGETDNTFEEARRYEQELRNAQSEGGNDGFILDIALLGLGTDGHTASLFPNSASLAETEKWIVPSEAPSPPRERITMTLPLINRSRHILFLVSGAEKASVLAKILSPSVAGERADPSGTLPAQLVAPKRGDVVWYLDQASASSF